MTGRDERVLIYRQCVLCNNTEYDYNADMRSMPHS